MRRPIGYFWTARHSQIYPELAALERDGLISHRVVTGRGPRDTKRYRITTAGRRELAKWINEPYEPASPKDEFMLRVYSLWIVDPADAIALIDSARAHHRDAVAAYERTEASMRAEDGDDMNDPGSPAFYNYATLRRGLSFELHALDWCDWLLERMRGQDPHQQ